MTHVSSLSDPLPDDVPSWTEAADSPAPSSRFAVRPASRIFCNRSLNMNAIAAVGFDMDYTLAMYRPETFEVLAYTQTCRKLVDVYGYPPEVLDLEYDHTYMVRGLVVDKKRGNVLKMDRHKYVKVARHGFSTLGTDERLKTYCDVQKVDQFDGSNYANVDTLFSLGETYLFCQLVELKEARAAAAAKSSSDAEPDFFAGKSFEAMYDEIRASVDLCHRDGSLKRAVAEHPERYIHPDEALVPMLRALRDSGKKTFLLTNSLWDFTNVVMNYLVHGAVGEDKTSDWTELFDAIITGSCKPAFFENERAAIFEVDAETSDLRNTDDGAPMLPIGASAAASTADDALRSSFGGMGKGKHEGVKAYQGGSFKHLHAMLGVTSGSQVLYVGDHIYGDILRSKKTLGWRTMLVVPELQHELECLQRADEAGFPEKLRKLRQRRDALSDAVQLSAWRGGRVLAEAAAADAASEGDSDSEPDSDSDSDSDSDAFRSADEEERASLAAEAERAKEAHRLGMRELHATFHPVWGAMMKAGNQNSRFAHQLERYACLYTSHARNLVAYSPAKSYRGLSDAMPHDLENERWG